jgi:hypothetical protein
MRVAGMLMLLAGCKERERAEARPVEAPKMEIDLAAAQRATTHSVPRRDWPCRLSGKGSDGSAVEIAIHYTERESCTLPVEKHAMGITGCVSELVASVQDPDGLVHPATERFTYLGATFEDSAPSMLVWENGLVVGHGTNGVLAAPYMLTPGGVRFTRGDVTSNMTIVDGKLVASTDTAGNQSEHFQLEWAGERLVRIHKERTSPWVTIDLQLAYDCRD